ncbi:hypothetical protein DFO70_101247 [Cytobacillus firmus]|uniref:Uncharacterized protein n=2 Tax=Cytobacillus TaxID=2675230 RepID=A0A366K420_CYTFI|nr:MULTISPECIES: hypothetical protein [Cytobacillus]RBP96440.1 hypothetical protein DFO70_101247 [Cytobacillus firmus]TDX45833.1 hypothetical protein DFO72_102309 [Cytobacillus oceanisediminis]
MSHTLQGNIITGVYDAETSAFEIQKVKNFSTQSVLNKNQCENLYNYLSLHEEDEGGQIITLYDQMPLMLTRQEIGNLKKDLENIKKLYQ